MAILSRTLLALSSIAAIAHALPKVTPVRAEGGCSVYPDYHEDTGIAGPWTIQIDQCTNSTTGEVCDNEGFGSGSEVRRQAGDTGIRQGLITIVHRNDIAKNPLRCNSAADSPLEAWVPSGVSGYDWKAVQFSDIPYSAPLMWGLPDEYSRAVEPYYHEDEDGVRQEGIFLGSGNVTSWAVSYSEPGAGTISGLPYYFIRLLGPGSEDPQTGEPLSEGESETFIKVYGS